MVIIAGYEIVEKIHESARTIVYRAHALQAKRTVIVKILKDEYPDPKEIAKLIHEYEIAQGLDDENFVKSYELKKYENSFALILEDFGGISLKNLISSCRIDLNIFLKIAIRLTVALGKLHENNIIHKDIKPQNIIINLKEEKFKVADFSIASYLAQETKINSRPNAFEGTLAYMSPEQTGRMNRTIDYRTDFYSLGVTLYETLTGQLPFTTSDPVELIHFHIAKKPVSPHQLNSVIPQAVSDIIMKLMAKTAEDRYQSAYGIQKDLEACLTQLQTSGAISRFALGQHDVSAKFQICQKLYGREDEIAALMSAFDRVSHGSTEIMLVSGYSGIGKTALIHEIHKPVVRQRGYFITGKFDQYKQNIPYCSVIQAFGELISQLVTESAIQIEHWRRKLLDALGNNGQVIIDVIPEVELIIGPQPPIPTLEPSESQNRFNLILQRFIEVFTQKEHPLVLFLDDLQWADSASLRLLQLLTTSSSNHYLLLIGAYRDNEVSAAHPLMLTLEEIRKTGATVGEIQLHPLLLEHVMQLISDTLHQDVEQVQSLAELVFHKTAGNPFFLAQMLITLYQEKLLSFNASKGCWAWNVEHIDLKGMTDNVIELMLNKIQKLSSSTQDVLKFAACIGNIFDLKSLSLVTEKSLSTTATELWGAIQEGLIFPLNENYQLLLLEQLQACLVESDTVGQVHYKFLHDRVQQAAYSLLAESERKQTHLKIGRLILSNTEVTRLDDHLFDIVNHWNIGVEQIVDDSEKLKLAQLNLAAGRKAKASTAYDVALQCFNLGLSVLTGDIWHHHYELTFSLYKESSECAYLCGKFDQATEQFDLLLSQARSTVEKAEVYNLKVLLHAFQNQASEAIKAGLEGLRMLELDIPESAELLQVEIERELAELTLHVGDRDLNDLLSTPTMTDPKQQAMIKLLFCLGFPTYQTNKSLMTYNTLKMLNLSLQYGFAKESPDAFCNYAQALGSVFEDYEAANRFGKFALKLNERIHNYQLNSKMNFWYGLCILPWREHLNLGLPHLNRGYQCGLETGDLVHSILSCYWIVMSHLTLGHPLDTVHEEWERYSKVVQQNPCFYDPYCSIKGLVLSLKGLANQPCSLSYQDFDEAEFIRRNEVLDVRDVNLHFYYQFKLQLLYLQENYVEASQMAAESEKTLVPLRDTTIAPDHYFYQSLTLTALYPNATADEQQHYWTLLERNQEKMKRWADNCPDNFLHRYYLVEAERVRLLGKNLEAMNLYDLAIESARANEYVQNEAIANELAAKFFLTQGRRKIAKVYLMDARHSYIKWGATLKVKDLDEKYAQFLSNLSVDTSIDRTVSTLTNTTNSTFLTGTNVIDVLTIMKASQALASEIILHKLVHKLLRIVMENAGAETSCLILEKEGQLVVEAMGQVDQDEIPLCTSMAVEDCQQIPASIVNYVARTRENVVLADVVKDNKFASDPYIVTVQPSSVLCMPIINQGKLIGLLYLENNLTSNAFTPDRLEILKLLSSQIAISLENALLYGNLEAATQHVKQANIKLEEYNRTLELKVEERTLELTEKNGCLKEQAEHLEQTLDELKKTQAQLIQTEKMSSLGQLVAGVAHEINNPVNFIYGNLRHTDSYMQGLLRLVDLYQQSYPNATPEIQTQIEELDLGFLAEDLPKVLKSMQIGADRIRQIVLSLRNFSRLDEADMKPVHIQDGIESTLLILQHRIHEKLNTKIQVMREYGDLPQVECFAGQLNQVFMNILSNALDALEERDRQGVQENLLQESSMIRIVTEQVDDEWVRIRIADNGPGMTEEVRRRLFDPFFTTKPVGAGTGLGLSISYQIVVDKHKGQLKCHSVPGQGAEFVIEIPIQQSKSSEVVR